ncbi:MAG: hypothetical protein AB1746_06860 [Candidatus Zixiibacteriota bacterium]
MLEAATLPEIEFAIKLISFSGRFLRKFHWIIFTFMELRGIGFVFLFLNVLHHFCSKIAGRAPSWPSVCLNDMSGTIAKNTIANIGIVIKRQSRLLAFSLPPVRTRHFDAIIATIIYTPSIIPPAERFTIKVMGILLKEIFI